MQTNGINYFFNGINAVNNGYKYDKLPDDQKNEIEVVKATGKYEGKVEHLPDEENGKTSVMVDGAIRISYNVSIQNSAVQEWSALKNQSKKLFKVTLITGIVTVLASVATGIAALKLPFILIVAIPVFIIGISILIIAGRARVNQKNAEIERTKWNDHTLSAKLHRIMAQKNGFTYIFKNQLKDEYFHPEEVKERWYEYEMKDITHSEDVIHDFFTDNPLEIEAINYAFDNNVPKSIQDLSSKFIALKQNYNFIRETAEIAIHTLKQVGDEYGILQVRNTEQNSILKLQPAAQKIKNGFVQAKVWNVL